MRTDSASSTATTAAANDYPTVKAESLPYSLRHLSRGCALDDAKHLVQFVDEILYFQGQADDRELTQSGNVGMQLVIALIKDKLDIASGEYHLPLSSHDSDTELAQRVG